MVVQQLQDAVATVPWFALPVTMIVQAVVQALQHYISSHQTAEQVNGTLDKMMTVRSPQSHYQDVAQQPAPQPPDKVA
jgi:hypothetical protein